MRTKARKPSVAGMFYPNDKTSLMEMVNSYLAAVNTKAVSSALAIVVPHAGYPYSGPVAASAYKAISDYDFDTAILLGRSHRFPFEGVILDSSESYEMPFGVCEIDEELYSHASGFRHVMEDDKAHAVEHSLEVQLPFIHSINPNAKILPLLFGSDYTKTIKETAEDLNKMKNAFPNKKILIVCSTDLSHYHPYDEARSIDSKLVAYLKVMDTTSMSIAFEHDEIEACGASALLATLHYAKMNERNGVDVLDFRNSGDTQGEKSKVVGYLSAVI